MRRLLRGEYAAAARRDSQLHRDQARVRGHPGQTPGPAAPSYFFFAGHRIRVEITAAIGRRAFAHA